MSWFFWIVLLCAWVSSCWLSFKGGGAKVERDTLLQLNEVIRRTDLAKEAAADLTGDALDLRLRRPASSGSDPQHWRNIL